MCIAHRLLLSTSEISDATASMPSPGYFALQHRVAPPCKAYSLTSSAFLAFGALYPFSLFKPVFRGDLLFFQFLLVISADMLYNVLVGFVFSQSHYTTKKAASFIFWGCSLFFCFFTAPAMSTKQWSAAFAGAVLCAGALM